MPGWLDNGFHAHRKRELVALACDGLLARAISRASDQLTDGWVEATWVDKQTADNMLTRSQRRQVLELAIQNRLLERLRAGETCVLRGGVRRGLRRDEITVTVGPFDVDGYVIHDFLDCNRARTEVESRRQKDRERQRARRNGTAQDPLPWEHRGGSDGSPSSSLSAGRHGLCPPDVRRDSRDRDRGLRGETTSGGTSNDARARSSSPQVQQVLDVLHQAPRLHVDAVGVENAIDRWPNEDAVRAAREVITWVTDPAFRGTNGASLLNAALSREQQRRTAARRVGSRGGQQAGMDQARRFAEMAEGGSR